VSGTAAACSRASPATISLIADLGCCAERREHKGHEGHKGHKEELEDTGKSSILCDLRVPSVAVLLGTLGPGGAEGRMTEGRERVTYATLAAGQTEEFRRKYDEAVERLGAAFGAHHPHVIDGRPEFSSEEFEDRNPADTRVLLGPSSGRPGRGSGGQTAGAAPIGAPPLVEPSPRCAAPPDHRGGGSSSQHGRPRGEEPAGAMGGATETADRCATTASRWRRTTVSTDRWAASRRRNPLGAAPYGVWAVISPFNFAALWVGRPPGLVAGNTRWC
jgi:hypothetical protein